VVATPPTDGHEPAQTRAAHLPRPYKQEQQWAVEHAAFIKAHNTFVEESGLPLEDYRMF